MMKKVRVAQIGTSVNSHGSEVFPSMVRQPDLFEIVGYTLPENEREKFPRKVGVFDGYREMTLDEILSDPSIDAVTVETEEIYLTEYALKAAEAGKHIHMEKPGGTDLGRFEQLVSVLKEKGLVFSIGYMYRFNPIIRSVIERVKRGELGEIYSVEAHMDCKHGPELRRWLSAFPGGMTFFLGCHLLDLIYTLQGEPDEVIPLSCPTGADGVTADDYGMAVLKYKNGVSFAKTCANEKGGFLRRQLVVCGTKGTIEIKPLEKVYKPDDKNLLYTVANECFGDAWHEEGKVKRSEPYNRYDAMMRNFAQMVLGEKKNPYSYDYELGLRRLLQKCCGQN